MRPPLTLGPLSLPASSSKGHLEDAKENRESGGPKGQSCTIKAARALLSFQVWGNQFKGKPRMPLLGANVILLPVPASSAEIRHPSNKQV